MNQLGDILVDSLEFARGGRCMEGVVPVSAFRRLADALADEDGELTWRVCGEIDGERRAFLTIEVDGSLNLRCQRCLDVMAFDVALDSRLRLMAPGEGWPDEALEDDSVDPVEALKEQSLLDLVEDELLLALPIAPSHASCSIPEHDDGRIAASPFASLARLKH